MTPIRRVWVTRAEPGAARTADRLTALGFTPIVAPLLTLASLPGALHAAPDPAAVAAEAILDRRPALRHGTLRGPPAPIAFV